MIRQLLSTLPALIVLLLTPVACHGGLIVYTDQSSFLADTGAVATTPLPNTSGTVTSLAVGDLTFTTPSPNFASGAFSNRLSGNVISITDLEDLNVTLASSVFSFGFEFHEPEFDPNIFGTFVDSQFAVDLFNQGTAVGSFSYNAPNDTAAFVGVMSTLPFDRVEIRETTGALENEFFGQFYIGTQSAVVPEPSTFLMWGIGALALAGIRRSRAHRCFSLA